MENIAPIRCQARSFTNDIVFDALTVAHKLRSVEPKLCQTPDDLPPIIFSKLAEELAEPLALIFTRSFEDAETPALFKSSIVTPVFNKGSRQLASNYRPVGQTSVACLTMESIRNDRIQSHLESQKLTDPFQHGFTKRRSTATQLLDVSQFLALSKNRNIPGHIVYFDFSRAFDSMDFGLLFEKMRALGLGDRITKWLRSYLSGRDFRVVINGVHP